MTKQINYAKYSEIPLREFCCLMMHYCNCVDPQNEGYVTSIGLNSMKKFLNEIVDDENSPAMKSIQHISKKKNITPAHLAGLMEALCDEFVVLKREEFIQLLDNQKI